MDYSNLTERLARIYFDALSIGEDYSAQEIDALFRLYSGGIGIKTCYPNGIVHEKAA